MASFQLQRAQKKPITLYLKKRKKKPHNTKIWLKNKLANQNYIIKYFLHAAQQSIMHYIKAMRLFIRFYNIIKNNLYVTLFKIFKPIQEFFNVKP